MKRRVSFRTYMIPTAHSNDNGYVAVILEKHDVDPKGYNRLVELRRTCFDQIVKDFVSAQTK